MTTHLTNFERRQLLDETIDVLTARVRDAERTLATLRRELCAAIAERAQVPDTRQGAKA